MRKRHGLQFLRATFQLEVNSAQMILTRMLDCGLGPNLRREVAAKTNSFWATDKHFQIQSLVCHHSSRMVSCGLRLMPVLKDFWRIIPSIFILLPPAKKRRRRSPQPVFNMATALKASNHIMKHTLPVLAATKLFCIFIASITQISCPSTTWLKREHWLKCCQGVLKIQRPGMLLGQNKIDEFMAGCVGFLLCELPQADL